MIKNEYEILNGIVYMKVSYKDENYICEFDESDFDLVSSYNAKWSVKKQNGKIIYVRCSRMINGDNSISLHRILYNFPKDMFVDHIDRNPLNNKRENLRLADIKTNSQNRSKNRTNKHKEPTSKYKGVHVIKNKKSSNTYVVYFKQNKVGVFKDEIIASNYYNHMAIKDFGEFACLNDVPYVSLEKCEKAKFYGTSKVKGIHYNTKEKKWIVQIYNKEEKMQFRIGRYDTEEDAILALKKYKEESTICF